MASRSLPLRMNPQFTDYRILDDAAEEFPSPPQTELILCDSARGVSDPAVTAALRSWLDSSPAIDETEVPY